MECRTVSRSSPAALHENLPGHLVQSGLQKKTSPPAAGTSAGRTGSTRRTQNKSDTAAGQDHPDKTIAPRVRRRRHNGLAVSQFRDCALPSAQPRFFQGTPTKDTSTEMRQSRLRHIEGRGGGATGGGNLRCLVASIDVEVSSDGTPHFNW